MIAPICRVFRVIERQGWHERNAGSEVGAFGVWRTRATVIREPLPTAPMVGYGVRVNLPSIFIQRYSLFRCPTMLNRRSTTHHPA